MSQIFDFVVLACILTCLQKTEGQMYNSGYGMYGQQQYGGKMAFPYFVSKFFLFRL